MGECLGWNQARVDAELDYVRTRLRLAASGRALLAEPLVHPDLVCIVATVWHSDASVATQIQLPGMLRCEGALSGEAGSAR